MLMLSGTPCLRAQTAAYRLDDAYRKKSPELLDDFFKYWQAETPTVSAGELDTASELQRECYDVFTAFYRPLAIDSLGGTDWDNGLYWHVRYLLVQNSIYVFTVDKIHYTDAEEDAYITARVKKAYPNDSAMRAYLLHRSPDGQLPYPTWARFAPNTRVRYPFVKNMPADSIMDFRPPVKAADKVPVYLTPAYEDLLVTFLGNQDMPLGSGRGPYPTRSRKESGNRKKFLETYIRLFYGHWGGYWQLVSYPLVHYVTFDRNREYARVDFRMVYEGGEAVLHKENGQWTLLSVQRTWMN